MKNIFKSLIVLAAVSAAAVSCKETNEYEWGEGDITGCYGVYFPVQEASGSHTLDPTQEPSATITAKRTNTDGAITVPVVTTFSEDGVFEVSPISFENGQSETTFTLSFPNAKEGTTYSASIEIQDPQYVSKYNSNPVAIDYSVIRVAWNDSVDPQGETSVVTFTEGWWGEEHDVHIKYYEVDGLRHCKIDGTETCDYVYSGGKCEGGIWGNGADFEFTWDTKTNKINVPKQVMFLYSEGVYAYVYGWYEFLISDGGYSASQWNGSDDFYAKNGSAYPQSYYDGNGGFYFNLRYYVPGLGGWTPDTFDVVGIASGYTRVDYSIELTSDETSDGVLPVALELGADVAKVKYAAYEGTLSATQISNKVAGITDGSETNVSEYVPVEDENVIGVTLEKTGVYTLVAVTFDATGEAHESASIEFDYVAKGDDVPVSVSCGLAATDKYTPEGYTSENSLEYYIYGKDLKDVKVGIFSKVDMSDSLACVESLKASKSVSDSVLTVINSKGAVDIAAGLSPGTTYYLLVWASNGYQSDVISATATTNGDPLPVYMKYTYASYADEFEPKSESVLYGTYNLYGIDATGTLGVREYLGKAVIADSDTPNEGPDKDGYNDEYITIKGLGGPACAKAKVDDTMEFDLYGGCFYNVGKTTVDGKTDTYVFALGNGKFYSGSVTYGIPVLDGYYAIVSLASYASSYNFSGYAFYNSEVDENSIFAVYYDYLLVDPAKDNNGLAPKAAEARLAQIKKTLATATAQGLGGKEAIRNALSSCSPVNLYNPAGVQAEWEGVSVPVKTATVSNGFASKSAKDQPLSKASTLNLK